MDFNNIDKILYNSFNHNNEHIMINELNYDVETDIVNMIDMSSNFPKIYNQGIMGITSSCAIVSIMTYYLKKIYNIDKLFSPYYLAYHQYKVTKSWESIDLFTGLNISSNFGICSDYLVSEHTKYEDIDLELVSIDANKYRFGYFSKIKFNIENLERLLNDSTPIVCSIKIIPILNNNLDETCINKFYNNFNNYNYWTNVNNYYKNKTDIYSISVVIVGYNSLQKVFKIRGCWGDKVGDNGYFYISYDIINLFNNLFFDQYIISSIIPIINSNNNLELSVNDIIVHNDKIIDNNIYEINKKTSFSKTKSFNKISSSSSLSESIIKIDSFNDLNSLLEEMKHEMDNLNVAINVY